MKPSIGLSRFVFVAVLFAGCGGGSNTSGTVINDGDSHPETSLGLPCLGEGFDENAANFNDQCLGLTECTDMTAPKGQTSGCYCNLCGPKGNEMVCMQASCFTPGG